MRRPAGAVSPQREGGRTAPGRRRPPGTAGGEPREAAAAIVRAVTEDHQSLATALDEASGALARLDARDAALARAIARVTVRRRGDIDWCLAGLMAKPLPKKASAVRAVLRLSAAQILFMRQAEHAAVNVAVALLKGDGATAGFSGLANAVLRRLARERDDLLARLPAEANTPSWLWRRWVAHYGEAAAAAMAAAHREEPGLDLAVAPGTVAPDGVPLPTGGVRLPAGDVTTIDGYAGGGWWVQDWAAQLPVTLLGDVAGLHVADLCAAPGGKTMQLAAAGARVTAVEVDAARAERLRENLARTRLSDRVEVVVADALDVGGRYDAVLLDAPCTATGTLRRQPDVAWAKAPGDIASLAAVQRRLLTHAASLVREGGLLVYATCSLEPEEGEGQLAHAAGLPLALEPVPDGPAAPFRTAEGTMRTLPSLGVPDGPQGLDGFFAARFRRI